MHYENIDRLQTAFPQSRMHMGGGGGDFPRWGRDDQIFETHFSEKYSSEFTGFT